MRPADSYRQQISDLGLDHLRLQADTAPEAKALLAQVRGWEKELRLMKQYINADMKEIRAVYSQRMSSAAATTSGILSIIRQTKAGWLSACE